MNRRRFRRFLAIGFAVALAGVLSAADGPARIEARDLREWLTYLASDQLEGRAIFSTGIGLAATYIADHLRDWGVEPAGDPGSFLQTVRILGVRSTNRSSVTVEINGETRTFVDGQGVTFPKNVGGKRTVTIDRV